MKRSTSNIIIISVLSTVVILGVWGYFSQKNTNEELLPKIMQDVILPYQKHLKNDNYEKAYNEFTSKGYRQKHSMKEFFTAQNKNTDRYGELDSIKPISGIVIREKPMEGPWKYFLTLGYYGKKDSQKIIMEFITKDKAFVINNSYISTVTIKNKKPMIY